MQCRLIETKSGDDLNVRYWSGSAWKRTGNTVASGTIGVALQEQSTPLELENGQVVSGFVEMQWPDAAEAVGAAGGWVASDYTRIVACNQQATATQASNLYYDPASDPADRPLPKAGSILPLLGLVAFSYWALK